MVGLCVLRLIPYPTVVALLYVQLENTGSKSEEIVLIFNISAGFCDVAFTTIVAGVFWIMGLIGSNLGGEDILQNMNALPQWMYMLLKKTEKMEYGVALSCDSG